MLRRAHRLLQEELRQRGGGLDGGVRALREAFAEVDEDLSGTVGPKEFAAVLREQELGTLLSKHDMRKLVHVLAGDWGMVTAQLTEAYGVVFAVLNMVGSGTLF